MNPKYNIEISIVYDDEWKGLPSIAVYMKGFMNWLEKEGHRVTFSMDKHTKIDSINVIDDKSFAKVYLKLHRDYVLYLDKKRS